MRKLTWRKVIGEVAYWTIAVAFAGVVMVLYRVFDVANKPDVIYYGYGPVCMLIGLVAARLLRKALKS